MSRIDEIIEHSRRRERELTGMAERLANQQNAVIMEVARERDQLQADLERANRLLEQWLRRSGREIVAGTLEDRTRVFLIKAQSR